MPYAHVIFGQKKRIKYLIISKKSFKDSVKSLPSI